MTIQEIIALTKPMYMQIGLDLFFTILFIMDQILRMLAYRNIKKFFNSNLNLLEFVCNIVSVIVIVYWFRLDYLPVSLENISHFFRTIRILRIIRDFPDLAIMAYAVQVYIIDIFFFFILFVFVIFFSGAIFFISELAGGDFQRKKGINIPMNFYWAGSTISTIGDGYHVPTWAVSRIIAIVTIMLSIIFFFPLPLMVREINMYHNIESLKSNKITPIVKKLQKQKKIN